MPARKAAGRSWPARSRRPARRRASGGQAGAGPSRTAAGVSGPGQSRLPARRRERDSSDRAATVPARAVVGRSQFPIPISSSPKDTLLIEQISASKQPQLNPPIHLNSYPSDFTPLSTNTSSYALTSAHTSQPICLSPLISTNAPQAYLSPYTAAHTPQPIHLRGSGSAHWHKVAINLSPHASACVHTHQ